MKETINKLYQEWLSLQPLNENDQIRLNQKFMLEFNYNSNHIEGNTLTYGQAELLLMFGKVVDEANMKDLEEMKAHNVGLKMIREESMNKEYPLTENFIRTLHKTLLREDYTVYRKLPNGTTTSYIVHAGCYKTRPNSVITVTGERFEYASPEETPALMSDLVTWYNEEEKKGELTPIELASVFHYRYIRIHPFEDGNGRIARLLVNFILIRHNYPMVIVQSKDKERYLSALNRCDIIVGGIPSDGAHAKYTQLSAFIEYMRKCLIHSLKLCIKAAKGENIEDDDDFEKRIKILERQQLQPMVINEDEFHRIDKRISDISLLIKEKISGLNNFFHKIEVKSFMHSGEANYNIPFDGISIICVCYDNNKNLIKNESRLQADIEILFKEKTYYVPILDKEFLYGTDFSSKDISLLIKKIRELLITQLEHILSKQ